MKMPNPFTTVLMMLLMQCSPKDPLATMPNFTIVFADSTIGSTAQLEHGKPYLLIHFDASCKGCQEETDTLIKYMDKMNNVNLLFLTVQDLESVRLYQRYFKLERFKNVTVAFDRDSSLAKHFGTATTPLLAIYDRNKNLRGVFEGQADMQKLLATVKEIQ
ncbi:thioredoxin-like domain-containing protein [uncultured Pedobacter sp.]|uniref:peroxiredoxin family protein n=1 Tax=uncultured Pedobacter sp. TaxID=246139 RepID=UPI0026083827|nr:thioredoxin-like domain-containing protein [uncultured Pedobacter sp.]